MCLEPIRSDDLRPIRGAYAGHGGALRICLRRRSRERDLIVRDKRESGLTDGCPRGRSIAVPHLDLARELIGIAINIRPASAGITRRFLFRERMSFCSSVAFFLI